MTVFGRLTIIGEDKAQLKPGRVYVVVRCTCGTVKSVRKDALTSGATVSCGCKKSTHGLKHGHRRIGSKDPTYQAWDGMLQRCTCLLYTSDAADDLLCVDLGGRRIIKKKNKQ